MRVAHNSLTSDSKVMQYQQNIYFKMLSQISYYSMSRTYTSIVIIIIILLLLLLFTKVIL